jgi:hypothetical protein
MAKLTFYKVAAVVYDIYCKSQSGDAEDKTPVYKILEYHKIGHQIQDAMVALGIYEGRGSKIIWKANPPTIELIEKINNKRKEFYDSWKAKNNDQSKKENKTESVNDLENKYTSAVGELQKALLRINELEKRLEFKQPEKKSFINKLFN